MSLKSFVTFPLICAFLPRPSAPTSNRPSFISMINCLQNKLKGWHRKGSSVSQCVWDPMHSAVSTGVTIIQDYPKIEGGWWLPDNAITQCVGVPHFHFDSPSKFCFSIVKLWMSRWKGGWGRLVFAARCSHVTWKRRLVGLGYPLCNGIFTSPSKHFVLSLFVLLLLIVSQTWEYWWYHLWVLRMRKSTIGFGGQI